MKKGIEVEYWVIDRTGALTTPDALTDGSKYVEEEFVDPLLELKTPPCETAAELRTTFVELLDDLLSCADELDKLLVPLGTPINCGSIGLLPSERARIQRRVVGGNFDYAKYCAGTHLHFERGNVRDQLNVLTALDPALALLNSSPYFEGRRVADGARAYLYREKSYEHFPKHGQLWDYVDTVAQWDRRLERRFAEFKDAALAVDVDEERFDANFSPENAVWTPVRLREAMPTVEWRSPDAALPSQILRLVEAVTSVMERVDRADVRIEGTRGGVTGDRITLPEFDTVCTLSENAIHGGCRSPGVTPYLQRMGFDVAAYDPITRAIGHRQYVSPNEARRLRVQYGELLKRDVQNLRRMRAA